MRTPHTATTKGKRVKIKLYTGEVIISKFLGKVSKFVITESGKIPTNQIKSFNIYKPLQHEL